MDINHVEFPGLWGLKFTIGRSFDLFGIPIYWYGVIIAFGFLLAVLLGIRASRKFGLEPDHIIDLVLFAAPVAIVFSRLYYVVFNWNYFSQYPEDIINTRKGGLAIYGGIIGALLVAWLFARRKKLGVLRLLDFGVPYLILAQGIGRWGNFVNQEAFGTNTTLPWGMTSESVVQHLNYILANPQEYPYINPATIQPELPVHPTFLYESLWNILAFFFLIWFRKRKKVEGEVFFLYMILYGFGRFFIEGLRTDSLLIEGSPIRVSQLLAGVLVVIFIAVFLLMRNAGWRASMIGIFRPKEEEPVEIGQSRYGAVLAKLKEDEAVRVEDTEETPMGNNDMDNAAENNTEDKTEEDTKEG